MIAEISKKNEEKLDDTIIINWNKKLKYSRKKLFHIKRTVL